MAGGYAGGPNLAALCNEIEADIINRIFIAYTRTEAGDQVKDLVCNAAAASASAAAP